MTADVGPLTLTREELYELVWSKPMIELAKDFGLSDVALAKRCRKLGVPVPGRGYWARVAAGQTPRITPLKKRAEQNTDYSTLTFELPREERAADGRPPDTAEQNALRERIRALDLQCENELRVASPAVKRTAAHMKRPWRKEIVWNRGERSGPIISIEVSDDVADRALLVCERLLAGAAGLSWAFRAAAESEESQRQSQRQPHRYQPVPRLPDPLPLGHLVAEGEALSFRIDERRRQLDHVPTEEEKAKRRRGEYVYMPRWDFQPTGELRLHVSKPDSRHALRTWKDRARARLEEQIRTILLGFLDEALRIKANREKARLAEIRRRREEERRWKLAERRRANAKLVHQLEAQAGAWMRARLLRAYVRAVRRTVGDGKVEATLQGKKIDFITWAEYYADQLDPLSTTPHDSDLKQDRAGYYGADEKLEGTLRRIVGLDWQDSWKLIDADAETEAQSNMEDDQDEEDEEDED